MTYVLPTVVSQSNEGFDLTGIYTTYVQTSATSSTNSPDYPYYPCAPGTRATGTTGSVWMFATTTTTITQYQTCMINSSFVAVAVGGAGASTAVPEALAGHIGFYQNATSLTTGQGAWFMLSGTPTCLVSSAGMSVPLYTSDTAGALTGTLNTTSHYQISGLTCVVTASGSTASATACVGNSVSVRKPQAA